MTHALLAAALLLATTAQAAPVKVSFEFPDGPVVRFDSERCVDDVGSVSGKLLKTGEVLADNKGCLKVRGSDGAEYFVMKPDNGPCPDRILQTKTAALKPVKKAETC